MGKYDFQASVSDDAPLFFLGRIARIKGVHTAIEVARRTDRRLIIAGNVPDSQKEKSYFEAEIKPELDGDQIRFIGPVCDEEKNRYLGQAAALLMPIEWDEPFGIVMAEAMACGTPVIGRRRGAVPEVIKSGETGFLFDTIDEAVEAVEHIDAIDRRACWRRCKRLFSAQVLVDAYETLYKHFAFGGDRSRTTQEDIYKIGGK
jgi:glycosyltransferase involved in cell wall biosynthesis